MEGRFDLNSVLGAPLPCLILIRCILPSFLHHEMSCNQLRAFCVLISDIYDYGNIYDACRGLGSERRPGLAVLVNGLCLLRVFARVVKSKSACRVVEGGFFFPPSNLCIQTVD